MGKMEYHFDNSIYVTDKLGRPVLVKTKISPKFKGTKIYTRDKVAQRDFRKGKTNISGLDSERLDKYIYTYYKNGELHSRTIFDNPQKRRN